MDVSLVLTHDCNLACTYCYTGEKLRQRMSDEVAERALDLAFADDRPRVQVSFFGGEPLLEWPRLQRLADAAAARAQKSGKELVLSLTTNGTLLDEERVDFLNARGFFIGLSIDGVAAAHEATRPTRGGGSSFPQVAAALALLIRRHAWLETISVIDPRNVHRLGESVRWLVDQGVTRVALNPSYGATWSDDDLAAWERAYGEIAELYVARCRAERPVYINVIEDKLVSHAKGGYDEGDRCSLGGRSVAVSPAGHLYPCERMVGEDRDPSLRLGDVHRGVDLGRRLLLVAQAGPRSDECGGCGVKGRCTSFCACANRAESGDIGVPGGVQCWHEQMAMRIADLVGARLWRARNRHFLARVYAWQAA